MSYRFLHQSQSPNEYWPVPKYWLLSHKVITFSLYIFIYQEAVKKKLELTKQKQQLLEKQLEQQKFLISKMEKAKSMNPKDKTSIMDVSLNFVSIRSAEYIYSQYTDVKIISYPTVNWPVCVFDLYIQWLWDLN